MIRDRCFLPLSSEHDQSSGAEFLIFLLVTKWAGRLRTGDPTPVLVGTAMDRSESPFLVRVDLADYPLLILVLSHDGQKDFFSYGNLKE